MCFHSLNNFKKHLFWYQKKLLHFFFRNMLAKRAILLRSQQQHKKVFESNFFHWSKEIFWIAFTWGVADIVYHTCLQTPTQLQIQSFWTKKIWGYRQLHFIPLKRIILLLSYLLLCLHFDVPAGIRSHDLSVVSPLPKPLDYSPLL